MRGRRAVLLAAALATACGGATSSAPAEPGPRPDAAGPDATTQDPASADAASADAASADAASADAASADATEAAATPGAGAFPCGDTLCAPREICFYVENDCIRYILGDSGTCPGGLLLDDASGPPSCTPAPPIPTCVDPASMMFPTLDCVDPDGGGACQVNELPLPSGCSRSCHTDCA